jgi:hypothetical protein
MESSEFCRRRRFPGLAVEVLEGRALLSAVAGTSTLEIQPTGVRAVSHPTTPQAQSSQGKDANVGDALHVGGQYARTLFSRNTGTVVSNYAKALLRGNGKELSRLGNSRSVQQLDASFRSADNSSQAQSVHSSLKDFGRSISNDFKKIFG